MNTWFICLLSSALASSDIARESRSRNETVNHSIAIENSFQMSYFPFIQLHLLFKYWITKAQHVWVRPTSYKNAIVQKLISEEKTKTVNFRAHLKFNMLFLTWRQSLIYINSGLITKMLYVRLIQLNKNVHNSVAWWQ